MRALSISRLRRRAVRGNALGARFIDCAQWWRRHGATQQQPPCAAPAST